MGLETQVWARHLGVALGFRVRRVGLGFRVQARKPGVRLGFRVRARKIGMSLLSFRVRARKLGDCLAAMVRREGVLRQEAVQAQAEQ